MTSHSRVWRAGRGFTMIELIVVMVLMGILAAVGIGRFVNRDSFDADTFAEQARAMFRYAQKAAIAQNRPVYVRLDGSTISLCFNAALPCAADQQVLAPSGNNSGNDTAHCGKTWYCAGRPATLTYSLSPVATYAGSANYFYFDALGRPYDASNSTQFPGLTLTISGGGNARTVNVAAETGYVF